MLPSFHCCPFDFEQYNICKHHVDHGGRHRVANVDVHLVEHCDEQPVVCIGVHVVDHCTRMRDCSRLNCAGGG